MLHKRLPVALTEDEINLAVRGLLKPRKDKADYAGKPTRTKDKLKRQSGRPLGKTTGLPIFGAWCIAFQKNKTDRKMDAAISTWMKSEFPRRNTADFDKVHTARNMYNSGRFTRGKKPRAKSERYDANGDIVHGRLRKSPAKKTVLKGKINKSAGKKKLPRSKTNKTAVAKAAKKIMRKTTPRFKIIKAPIKTGMRSITTATKAEIDAAEKQSKAA